MSTLQERLRAMSVTMGDVHAAADRIDSLIGLLDATGVIVEELRQENEELKLKLYESKACQCGYDDVCEFARERDSLAQQVRTEQLYNQERGDRIAELEAYKQAHDEQVTLVNQIATERDALRANNRELLDHRFVLMNKVGEVSQQLSNLLCRIHRDGGHYEAEHGTAKAVADADVLVANLYAMQQDAERYRFARESRDVRIGIQAGVDTWPEYSHDALDQAIDAAIAAEKELK